MPDDRKSETAASATQVDRPAQDDLKDWKAAAIALVQRCVRNTQLEDLHAGIFPASQSGNYDDVKVVSPYGEIAWNDLSQISDEEMKALMIEVVNKVFTFLVHAETIGDRPSGAKWNEPEFDAALFALVERRRRSSGS